MADWDASIEMQIGGITTYNTFQVADVAAGGGPFESRASRIGESWINSVMSTLCADVTFTRAKVVSADGTTEEEEEFDQNGSLGGNALPVNSCVQFTKITNLGRNGRMYISGFPEESVDPAGKIASANRSAATDVFNLFVTDLLTKELQMIMDPFTAGSVGKNVIGGACGPYIVRQSRRLKRARR